MKIQDTHEAIDGLPGVDVDDTNTERFFPEFEGKLNVLDQGDFLDTFDEALEVATQHGNSFITFDFSKYAPGASAETDMPEEIYSVMVIKPLGNDKFDIVQSKPEQLIKDLSRAQLDTMIRKLSKKLEHEDIELEFRVLG